jgi:hypothetical protein
MPIWKIEIEIEVENRMEMEGPFGTLCSACPATSVQTQRLLYYGLTCRCEYSLSLGGHLFILFILFISIFCSQCCEKNRRPQHTVERGSNVSYYLFVRTNSNDRYSFNPTVCIYLYMSLYSQPKDYKANRSTELVTTNYIKAR